MYLVLTVGLMMVFIPPQDYGLLTTISYIGGVMLIYLEFFLPTGGFVGLTGIGMTWLVLTQLDYTVEVKLLALVGSLVVSAVTFMLCQTYSKGLKVSSGLVLTHLPTEVTKDNYSNELVGKTGLVFTDLRPVGKVSIEVEGSKRYYEAQSMDKQIKAGTPISVKSIRHNVLFVERSGSQTSVYE